jgi:hypothetical protein
MCGSGTWRKSNRVIRGFLRSFRKLPLEIVLSVSAAAAASSSQPSIRLCLVIISMGRRAVARPPGAVTRRRNTQACIPCQQAKRKCSSGLPCSYCVRRHCEPLCVYNYDRRRKNVARRRSPLSENPPNPGGLTQPPSRRASLGSRQTTLPASGQEPPLTILPPGPEEISIPEGTLATQANTQPRILKDINGNDGTVLYMAS